MSFLNKKYTPNSNSHSSHSPNPHSRVLPSTLPVRELPSESHCEIHPTQQIRHMCNECIELLCSECIGDHLVLHRQRNSFPTISTIRQLKSEMGHKVQILLDYLNNNSNKPLNVQGHKRSIIEKVDQLRKDILKVVDEWIVNLKGQLLGSSDLEEVVGLQDQISKLKEEVNLLKQSLITSNNPSIVKKAYQLDVQKLQTAYFGMVKRCNNIQSRSQCNFEVQWSSIVNSLNSNIKYKQRDNKIKHEIQRSLDLQKSDVFDMPLQKQYRHEENTLNMDKWQNPHEISSIENSNPHRNKNNNLNHILEESLAISQDYLYKIYLNEPNSIILYKLPELTQSKVNFGNSLLPLNSLIVTNNKIIISGGIVSQKVKSRCFRVYDLSLERFSKEIQMSEGRSSHIMIHDPHTNNIYIIGGFCQTSQAVVTQFYNINTQTLNTIKSNSKWGGCCVANLFNKTIIKVSVDGIQVLDLQKLVWFQVASQINFSISNGMRMQCSMRSNIIFGGNDNRYYKIQRNDKKTNIVSYEGGLNNVYSSIARDNKIYVCCIQGFFTYDQEKGWVKYLAESA